MFCPVLVLSAPRQGQDVSTTPRFIAARSLLGAWLVRVDCSTNNKSKNYGKLSSWLADRLANYAMQGCYLVKKHSAIYGSEGSSCSEQPITRSHPSPVESGPYTYTRILLRLTLCRYCVNRNFGETYRLHLQGRKIRERGTSVEQVAADGGDRFLRNVG
jgi:hypothetical protein